MRVNASNAFFASLLLGLASKVTAAGPPDQAPDWPFDVTEISAPDGSITAKFVSVGATLTELWVKDRNGEARDVVIGYDDNTKLLTDPYHPVFNAILGRYAGRIKNGTFSIPITKDPQPPGPGVYQLPLNDHDGEDTLHGGILGWDRRNWTVVNDHIHDGEDGARQVHKNKTSVTYRHLDDADEGFPGRVEAFTTHEVGNGGLFRTTIRAKASEKTPIMVSQHIYWNLDAYQDNQTDVLNHHLQLDASRVVRLDGNAVPTGDLLDLNAPENKDGVFDFRPVRTIGEYWNETLGLCGAPYCQGYDHQWIYDNDASKRNATSLWSESSGIRMDVTTNQAAVQIFTAFGLQLFPRKVVHGGPNLNYSNAGAVAIEQEGWADAINNPEWGIDQIYEPGKDLEWSTTYRFSTIP